MPLRQIVENDTAVIATGLFPGCTRRYRHVWLGLVLLLIGVLGCSTSNAQNPDAISEDSQAAVEVVVGLQAVVLDVMKNAESLGYTGRVRTLTPIVRASFDLPSLARRTLGPSWRSLSDDEKPGIRPATG